MPDYTEFLTESQLAAEEEAWESEKLHLRYVAGIARMCADYEVGSILEMGCGTGWVPRELPETLSYVGMDANRSCLNLAHRKNVTRPFYEGDVRTWIPGYQTDLVCCFAVLKHFALSEWKSVIHAVLRHGRYGLFTQPVALECRDDQKEMKLAWPHVWVDEATLQEAVKEAGHEVLWRDNHVEPLIATRRVP